MDKIKKFSLIFTFLAAFICLSLSFFSTNVYANNETTKANYVEKVASSYDELVKIIDEATSQTKIVINSDITLEDTITIPNGKDIIIVDDGEKRNIFMKDGAFNDKDIISVKEGGKFTLSSTSVGNLSLNNLSIYWNKGNHGIVHVNGTFTLDGAVIENCKLIGLRSGVVRVSGENAVFNMNSGYIRNNTYDVSGLSSYSGTVLIRDGGNMNFTGGAITDNKTSGSEKQRFITAGILVHSTKDGNATLNMSGSAEISNNVSTGSDSCGGGVLLLGANWTEGYNQNKSYLNMDAGKIINNTTEYAGGGVFVYGNASFTLNSGSIDGNTVNNGMGGGVSTYDYFTDMKKLTGQSDSYMPTWNQFVKSTFTMNGGNITNNNASSNSSVTDGGCGGGIYVASNDVTLNAGNISNNKATNQGGGVYVGSTPYVLKMFDTVVYNNTAEIIGGGAWFCPTGTAASSIENGGCVFDNKAGEAGDDIASISKTGDATLSLTNRLLGNWLVHWYEDGAISLNSGVLGNGDPDAKRYSNTSTQVGGIISKSTEAMALKSVSSDEGKKTAKDKAKLTISGNTALRGGGIGSNGAVIFNKYQEDFPTVDVSVTKKWVNTTSHPDKVVITLYQDGNKIDTLELNNDNNWEYTFKDLPKYKNNATENSENKEESVYTVSEEKITGFDSTISTEKDNKYSFIITNSPFREKGHITVTNKVTGKDGDKNKIFNFIITLDDKTINGKYGDVEFNNGVATFKLKHGESVNKKNIPAGIKFTIKEVEANQNDYVTSSTNATGVVPENDVINVHFVNHKEIGVNNKTENNNKTDSKNNPETSDSSNLMLYTVIAVISGMIVCSLAIFNKRKIKK